MYLSIPSHPDLKKIIVLNPKGGSGKSTIATNLTGYLAQNGYPVALMDCDPQGSAIRWISNRFKGLPEVYGIATCEHDDTMTRSFRLRVPRHIRHIVIDTPAALDIQSIVDYVHGAHALLVPVLPSDIDLHAATKLIRDLLLVAKVSRRMSRIGVVANRVRENTLGYKKLQQFLHRLDINVIGELRDSQNYVHAADRGISIHEMQPSKVRKDLETWGPVLAWLEEKLHTPLAARDLFRPEVSQGEPESSSLGGAVSQHAVGFKAC